MQLARSLERRIEQLVDGLAGKLFRGRVHPLELATRLARHADLNLSDGPTGLVAPNAYSLRLHPSDLAETPVALTRRLEQVVEELAAGHGWRLQGPAHVRVRVDATVPPGTVELRSSIIRGAPHPWGHLTELNGARRLPLRYNRLLVGRADDCDARLSDPEVSRHHALVWREGDSAWVEDLASSNGTLVNGEPVRGVAAIQSGDVVGFGHATFAYRQG